MTCEHRTVGICVLAHVGERVEVVQADPCVLVSDDLYRKTCDNPHPDAAAGEGMILVRGINRTVRYRLRPDSFCAMCQTWTADLR